MAVLIGGCILSGLPSAFRAGLEREHILSALRSKLEADAKAGMRLDEAAGRHLDALFPDAARSPMIGVYLETLRRRRFRSFGNLRVDGAPTLRSLPFPGTPTEVHDIEQDPTGAGRSGRAIGSDPYLVFDLGPPRRIAAVDIVLEVSTPDGTPSFVQVFWRLSSDTPAFSERNSRTCHVASGTSTSFRIWIDDEFDRLRIDPSNRACTFSLEKIDLVVPESEPRIRSEK